MLVVFYPMTAPCLSTKPGEVHYVWSLRSQAKVGLDQRVAVGSQRFHIERPCGTSVTRCLHPNGDASVLLLPPSKGKLPTLLLHLSHPK